MRSDPTRPPRRRRRLVVGAAAAAAAALLAGCAGNAGGASQHSNSINYALPPNFTPNWILPVGTAAHLNTNNLAIASALWENLVAYDGSTGRVAWNKNASVASAATFAPDAKSVTITLRKLSWSDGKPVTSRDVEFWYNLIKANKTQWAGYNPGQEPDNFTGFTTIDATHFKITFDRAYNTQWMLANELSQITPLPQHAWDRTSASGAVGNYDRSAAGAKQVWDFLNKASENINGYASDPLWKTIDGPYAIKSFATSGNVVLTKNTKYDGGEPAHISTVNLMPFTTSDAEENAVRSGAVDYGYISPTSLDQKSSFTAKGYQVTPWTGWAITYMPYNFNNPTMGPVFKQLYARQAVQMSVDQPSLAKVVFNGSATPGYGPIPQAQASSFVSAVQKNNPYPYDVSKAKALLTSHGWSENSGGVMVCQKPGTAADECGAGVAAGTQFSMNVLSQSGSTVTDNMMSVLQSDFSKTGIKFSIKTAPVNSVLSQTPQCKPSQPICKWQLSFFGTAGSWYFPAYPTGESLFKTGGSANFGSYSNSTVDSLITRTSTSTDPSAITKYSATVAEDLPVIWLPSPDYQISVIKNGIGGFAQDSLALFHPSQWQWTKS